MAPDRTVTRRFSSRWRRRSAPRGGLSSAVISLSARRGRTVLRHAGARKVIKRGFEQQSHPCENRPLAACFSAVILTEEDRRRCWLRLNQVSSIDSCCSPTRSIRRSGPASCEPATSHRSKPQHSSSTAHGTDSERSTKWKQPWRSSPPERNCSRSRPRDTS